MADVLDTLAYGDSSVEDVSDALAAVSWDYLVRLSAETGSIDYAGLLAGVDRAADTGIFEAGFSERGVSPAMDFGYMTNSLSLELFPAAVQGDRALFEDSIADGVPGVSPTVVNVDEPVESIADPAGLAGVGGEHRSPYVNGGSFVALDLNGDGGADFVMPTTDLFWPS